ncbi:hypothetical protein TNCV_1267911 [Trichonephila clavipes]|nr:hypothetical protein TNCV_1267911 [Trichonephila clavipes]
MHLSVTVTYTGMGTVVSTGPHGAVGATELILYNMYLFNTGTAIFGIHGNRMNIVLQARRNRRKTAEPNLKTNWTTDTLPEDKKCVP